MDDMVEHRVTAKDIDGVSLIGFRIDPDSKTPDLYTLMTYGAQEVPIVVDGKILFFRSPAGVKVAYDLFSEDIKKLASIPSEMDAVCDVAAALHTINHLDIDESATVLNCLNTLFDLVTAAQVSMPITYKRLLDNLADFLTFDNDFAEYPNRSGVERAEITNAVLWCVGAIVVNSKVLHTES